MKLSETFDFVFDAVKDATKEITVGLGKEIVHQVTGYEFKEVKQGEEYAQDCLMIEIGECQCCDECVNYEEYEERGEP